MESADKKADADDFKEAIADYDEATGDRGIDVGAIVSWWVLVLVGPIILILYFR